MNNAEQLREYKRLYGLTSLQVSQIMGISPYTVMSWLVNSDSAKHRPMPDNKLDYLKLKLRSRKRVK
jgi:hypothetical protein